jgi:O-succinylhomoserine sulfhydrylase
LGGVVVTFEVQGGVAAGQQFFDNIQLCSLSANLGDSRTIVTHPASTTHAKLDDEDKRAVGITDGLVRCSLGLEHVEDIIADIQQALQTL